MIPSGPVVSAQEIQKRTVLHRAHAARGARFSSFAGWELPVFYTSILQEHQVVRSGVGLFDVSHLGHLEVSGDQAMEALQPLVTQDLARLETARAVYTPMLNDRGYILDEMIVYHLEPGRFRFVVNAANGDKILSYLKEQLPAGVTLQDLRREVGTLALQGPRAAQTLSRVTEGSLDVMARYRVVAGTVAGRSAWVARTGYTGEDGFELFLKTVDLEPVWEKLLQVGAPLRIQPIGLGARDTLRLEAGLPLGGSDLDERTTPLEAGFDWTIAWEKGPFIGREALERQRQEGIRRRLVGFELRGPGIPRHGCPIFREDRKIGEVTSGTMVPSPHPLPSGERERVRGIGLGYVEPQWKEPGTEVLIELRGRRVPAEVVKLPFYRRKR